LKEHGFEIILFTAGNKFYMESILKHVFKSADYFAHTLSRDDMSVLANFKS
jgi:hypothetical protein